MHEQLAEYEKERFTGFRNQRFFLEHIPEDEERKRFIRYHMGNDPDGFKYKCFGSISSNIIQKVQELLCISPACILR